MNLRELAVATFVKRFDAEAFAPVYFNKRTGESFHEKPASMGPVNVEYADSWTTAWDSARVPFYVNMGSKKMSWTQPDGTIDCQKCPKNRQGRGEAFAIFYDPPSSTALCAVCFKGEKFTRGGGNWVSIDGGSTQKSRDEAAAVTLLARMCSTCQEDGADRKCHQCCALFCTECFLEFHQRAALKQGHTFEVVR